MQDISLPSPAGNIRIFAPRIYDVIDDILTISGMWAFDRIEVFTDELYVSSSRSVTWYPFTETALSNARKALKPGGTVLWIVATREDLKEASELHTALMTGRHYGLSIVVCSDPKNRSVVVRDQCAIAFHHAPFQS